MMTARVWVRGVVGRLARIEKGGNFLPTDKWQRVAINRMIERKAEAGDLEIAYRDPEEKLKVKPAENKKEDE